MKNTKKKIMVLILIMAIMITGSFVLNTGNVSAASNGRETESNNSIKAADTIAINSKYNGNTTSKEDIDYYKFTLKTAAAVKVDFGHKDQKTDIRYWEVALRDSKGKVILSTPVTGDQTHTYLTTIGLPPGTYYVSADVYGDIYCKATYALTVYADTANVWETEYNENKATADSIAVNKPCAGNIMYPKDKDWYKFTTTADGPVAVNFKHGLIKEDLGYWTVCLMDVNENVIVSKDVLGTETDIYLTNVGLPAGTYYVSVSGDTYKYSGSYRTRSSELTYSINVEHKATSKWETEYNDTKPTAKDVQLNEIYYGNSYKYGDVDYFKLETNSNGVVTVNFKHDLIKTEDNYWEVSLLDSENKKITAKTIRGDKADVALTKTGLDVGTYYVKVENKLFTTTPYSVRADFVQSSVWETESNDSRPTADVINTNKFYYGNSSSCGDEYCYGADVDYYKFELKNRKAVFINLKHNRVATEDELWWVKLQDEDGNELYDLDVTGVSTNVKSKKIVLDPGFYYMAIWSESDVTYSVNALIYATAAPKTVKTQLYGYDDVKVSWSKVSGANSYVVYYKTLSQDNWTKLGTTTGTSMKKANLKDGKTYKFRVVPYKKLSDGNYFGATGFSKNTYTLRQLAAPKVAKKGLKVKASWGKVKGADGYQVVQYKLKNGKYVKVKGFYTKNTYKTLVAKKGVKFYYKVRAYDNVNGTKIFAPYSKMKAFKR